MDVKNYEAVIIHYVNKKQYEDAINMLLDIENPNERYELMYRYSSTFLKS